MRRALLLATLLAAALNVSAGTGKIIILNSDKPGIGFNDITPATPVGGNSGTTLGEQRLKVFEEAARRWQYSIDTNVDIYVTATMAPIAGGCADSAAILGQAGPMYWEHSFEGAPRQNVWYPAALANKLAGRDLNPARTDIFAQFNADVDLASCLSTSNSDWYYGFDGNKGDDIDLFVVVLHELAHGLGIAGKSGGAEFSENRPSVFNTRMLDLTAGLRWDQMSTEQRRVSITNTANVVWDGENVRNNASRYLVPSLMLGINEPAAVARNYDIGFAAFGPVASAGTISGKIVLAQDAANTEGPTTTDGCSALSNAAEINGNIALIDRGSPPAPAPSCTFVKKVLNAQAAGARGVIIADNVRETCMPPSMGGSSDAVRIPVVSVTLDTGAALKQPLNANVAVNGGLRIDPSQLSGASQEGFVRLYAPCTQEPGSSTYHWDVVASPNLLMEPNVSSDLTHGLDLTLYQLLDIGWTLPARQGRTVLKKR